jgi:tRNA(Ile)-lysidine synthase
VSSLRPERLAVNLVYKVIKTIEKKGLVERGDRVLVGISGGIDSTSLLYVLVEIAKEIGFDLGAAHLNHLLRGEESERDEKFVAALAERLAIPLYTRRVDANKYANDKGLSIQHAGRDLRYGFFEEVADGHGFNKIALAHNQDDQAETFLLRMIKGTGIRGLSSIPVKRGRIIRPFLYIYRSEIEDYAKKNSIAFVHDSSNDKTVYERNFVRKRIIPLMEQLNPLLKEKIIALLEDLTAINHRYNETAEGFVREEMHTDGEDLSFEVSALRKIDEETRFRVIVHVLLHMKPGFMPLRDHMQLINRMLASEKPNQALVMPEGIRVRKVYGNLVFTKRAAPARLTEVFPIGIGTNRLELLGCVIDVSHVPGDRNVAYGANKQLAHFDQAKVGSLSVRTFLEGDRFYPLGMKNSVKLKDFFISQKVPKEQRRRVPLLLSGQDIIWVIGYRMDERYKTTEATREILEVTVRKV